MSAISTRRASYQKPRISIGKGHKRPVLNSIQRTALDNIKREIGLIGSANSDASADLHISNAYRLLRHLASDRLFNNNLKNLKK